MSKSIKQIFAVIWQKINVISAVFTCFFGITIFFIFSSTMTSFVGSFLHVHPSFTGGEIAGDFIAPVENYGLARYTVHQPVINAKWQQNAEYWQLVFEFTDSNTGSQELMLYIKLSTQNPEKVETKSIKTALSEASLKDYDFAVQLNDGEGKLFDNSGKYICNAEYYKLNNGSTVKLRIPLQDKRIQKVLAAKTTYHYIVPEKNSAISPLEVSMEIRKSSKKEKAENAVYVQHIKELYTQSKAFETLLQKPAGAPSPEDVDGCLSYYSQKLKENPMDYISMTYYGMYYAIKGGQSNFMSAISLVNEAFEYMDRAAALAYNKEDEIEVLLNRASVSASVPEQVFAKAESGAENFIRIVSLTDDVTLKAYCYVMAYECYEKCGKTSNAILALQEAKKMIQ